MRALPQSVEIVLFDLRKRERERKEQESKSRVEILQRANARFLEREFAEATLKPADEMPVSPTLRALISGRRSQAAE